MGSGGAYERKKDLLWDLATAHRGYFTAQQATEAGISSPYVEHYLRAGHIVRVSRGVYRLPRFPAGEQEDLIQVWMTTAREGVFSHETALALHQLSDILPSRIHVSLPPAWRRRKLPAHIERHYADLATSDVEWVGAVPVTTPRRTLEDCATVHVSPELLRHALQQARTRGLLREHEASELLQRHASAFLHTP